MTVLIFGSLTLDVLSVTGLDITDGWQFPDHDVVESKPLLQWTGTQLRTVTVDLRLHASWCDPAAQMERLRTMGGSVRAWPLLRASGAWLGRFVVTSLTEKDRWTLADGRPLWIEGALKLNEWAGTPANGVGPELSSGAASPLLRRRG